MKKIFFALIAVVAMASCSKDEVIEVNREQIGFGEAFVDNGTRADYSSGKSIDAFKVYGTLKGNGNTVQIFNGANVTRPTDLASGVYDQTKAWICNEVQYWVPSAEYNFAAIVDGVATATEGLPATIPFTVADGVDNKDLLYATATVTTNANAEPITGVNDKDFVAFTFDHLLSKVQFTVANEMATNYSIKVTGITVTGAKKDGLYTIGTENSTWTTTTEDTVPSLTFGTTGVIESANTAGASETRQILPVEQTLAVTIAYDINYKGTKVASTTKTGKISQSFVKNTVYNITAKIDATKIQFSVESVGGFNPSTGGDITIQ